MSKFYPASPIEISQHSPMAPRHSEEPDFNSSKYPEMQNFSSQMQFQRSENTTPANNKCELTVIAQGCGSRIYSDNNGHVLKCIQHAKLPDGSYRHRSACHLLKNEYKNLQNICHPNVIKYLKYK